MSSPAHVLELVAGALLLLGAAFALIGSFGLARLSDFFRRVHGPTKATTLGVGSVLAGACLWFGLRGQGGLHHLLILVFLFVTAPVSAHLLVRAMLRRRGMRPPPPPGGE